MFDVTDIVLIYFMSYNTDTSKKKKKIKNGSQNLKKNYQAKISTFL